MNFRKIKEYAATLNMPKKGVFGFLQGAIMSVVIIAILLGVSFNVLSGFQTGSTVNGSAYNATGSLITGLNIIPQQWSTIMWIVVAVVMIGLLGLFGSKGAGGR